MNSFQKVTLISSLIGLTILFPACSKNPPKPIGISFHTETLTRLGHPGDNWCITWTAEGHQVTSMCDGNWLNSELHYHNHLYRIVGDADAFTREDIPAYPQFLRELGGWFGYGVISVGNRIYSMVSKTPGEDWSGPFRGIKMLKSSDSGGSWYRVNSRGEERCLDPWDDTAREDISLEEMFFLEESGRFKRDRMAFPFSFCSFVQNGQANAAAQDDYIYIYSPEGSQTNHLLLARVKQDEIEKRDSGEYFGWYSWLPSVVWNEGLGLYIMVNGGTYAGRGLTNSGKDYYSAWIILKQAAWVSGIRKTLMVPGISSSIRTIGLWMTRRTEPTSPSCLPNGSVKTEKIWS
jgi:hypothetical protein